LVKKFLRCVSSPTGCTDRRTNALTHVQAEDIISPPISAKDRRIKVGLILLQVFMVL